jgi:hypothetical protein
MKILDNINYILEKNLLEIEDVIFLLNRVRIIIENNSQKNKYELLNFYGNWIAHSNIENLPSKIVNEIENASKTKTNRIQDHWMLRSELCSFFQEYSLDKSLLNNRDKWYKFSTSLYIILIDTPLIPKNESFSFIFNGTNQKENRTFSCSFVIEYKNELNNIKKFSGTYSVQDSLNEDNKAKWLTQEGICI